MIKYFRGSNKNLKKAIVSQALLLITFLFWTTMPYAAFAASPSDNLKFDAMSVQVSPEYDDPRVLVVMESMLSSDTDLPAKPNFLISSKEKDIEIGMACEVVNGGHQCKTYTTKNGKDFNELNFSVESSRDVFLEYYWDAFKGVKDNKRSFTYKYKAPYFIKDLTIQIQEPKNSSNFKIEPASASDGTDQEGIKEHAYNYTNVKAGDVFTFKVNYKSGGTSKSVNEKPGSQTSSNQASSTNSSGNQLLLFLTVLVVTVVVFTIYLRSQKAKTMSSSAPLKHKKNKINTAKNKERSRFCSNCGNALSMGDSFCAKCGSKVI